MKKYETVSNAKYMVTKVSTDAKGLTYRLSELKTSLVSEKAAS